MSSKVAVTTQNIKDVRTVRRGRDWCYGTQDIHPTEHRGMVGRIISIESGSMVRVMWENGKVYNYRIGSTGKYDLYVEEYHKETSTPTNPVSQSPYYQRNTTPLPDTALSLKDSTVNIKLMGRRRVIQVDQNN